jgi:hypothetical protein
VLSGADELTLDLLTRDGADRQQRADDGIDDEGGLP